MARFLYSSYPFTFRKYARYILAFSWLLGLGAGGLLFRYRADSLIPLMRLAASGQVSIVGLLTVSILPLIFSVFAVYIHCTGLLIPIAFFEACAYGYLSCGVFSAFGDAGWLLHLLLLFTDTGSLWVLYVYWLRHISGFRGFRFWNTAGYAAVLYLIAATDWRVITPLLRELPL